MTEESFKPILITDQTKLPINEISAQGKKIGSLATLLESNKFFGEFNIRFKEGRSVEAKLIQSIIF